jgi:hypothetical protein
LTALAPIRLRNIFPAYAVPKSGVHHHIAGAYLLRYAQERLGRRIIAASQMVIN